jgi:hypothetical protein
MRRVAEHADLAFAGRLGGAGAACGKIVLGVRHVRHYRRKGNAASPQQQGDAEQYRPAQPRQVMMCIHCDPPKNCKTVILPLNMSAI